jgi:predicted nucleic acid-binding protein
MKYLLDTNIFIEAKNRYYGLDFCPAFWDWLIEKNAAGTLASIEKVANEIANGSDELSEWVEARGKQFFLPADQAVLPALGEVSTWASTQNYEPAAIATFLDIADSLLVAHARAHSYTVVTHERLGDSPKKIKIPNACLALSIPCINPFEMLRRERARFVLGPGRTAA